MCARRRALIVLYALVLVCERVCTAQPLAPGVLRLYQETSHSLSVLVEKSEHSQEIGDGMCWQLHKRCVKKFSWHNQTFVGCTTASNEDSGWCGLQRNVQSGVGAYRTCKKVKCVRKEAYKYDVEDEPWWWLIAEPLEDQKQPSVQQFQGSLSQRLKDAWSQFSHNFEKEWSSGVLESMIRKLKESDSKESDSKGAVHATLSGLLLRHSVVHPDPKAGTVVWTRGDKKVFMRALPQRFCNKDVAEEFKLSFLLRLLPSILPHVRKDRCVFEIGGLEPETDYKLSLFQMADGGEVPTTPPLPHATLQMTTGPILQETMRVRNYLYCQFIVAFTSTLIALFLAVRYAKANIDLNFFGPLTSNDSGGYSQVAEGSSDTEMQNMGAAPKEKNTTRLTQSFIQSRFLPVVFDLCLALLMLAPIIGPACIICVWHFYFGWRMRMVREGQAKERLTMLLNVILNVILIPINLVSIQEYWLTYGHGMSKCLGLDFYADKSYDEITMLLDASESVSECEIVGLIPMILLSVFLMAMQAQSALVTKDIFNFKRESVRTLEKLRFLGGSGEFCVQLEAAFPRLFTVNSLKEKKMENDAKKVGARDMEIQGLLRKVGSALLAMLFAAIPHAWMAFRHSHRVSLFPPLGGHGVRASMITVQYFINMTGVCYRFLLKADEVFQAHAANIDQMTAFAALSLPPVKDSSRPPVGLNVGQPLFDWFETGTDNIRNVRNQLTGEPTTEVLRKRFDAFKKIDLDLGIKQHAQVWWRLRECIMIDIKDERIVMEMLLIVTGMATGLLGVAAFIANIVLQGVTAVTVVAAAIGIYGVQFVYQTLSNSKTINSMAKEHAGFLRSIVLEMTLEPDSHNQSSNNTQDMLLQFADLIEKQPLPETVAGFEVTEELFTKITSPLITLVIGTAGSFLYSLITLKF